MPGRSGAATGERVVGGALVGQLPHQIMNSGFGLDVHAAGKVVQQQHFGIQIQQAAKQDALLIVFAKAHAHRQARVGFQVDSHRKNDTAEGKFEQTWKKPLKEKPDRETTWRGKAGFRVVRDRRDWLPRSHFKPNDFDGAAGNCQGVGGDHRKRTGGPADKLNCG